MNDDKYKEYISNSINRLINENCIQINFNKQQKLVVYIEILQPQWYIDMNEEDKEIIISNLQSHYLNKISKINFKELLN